MDLLEALVSYEALIDSVADVLDIFETEILFATGAFPVVVKLPQFELAPPPAVVT